MQIGQNVNKSYRHIKINKDNRTKRLKQNEQKEKERTGEDPT